MTEDPRIEWSHSLGSKPPPWHNRWFRDRNRPLRELKPMSSNWIDVRGLGSGMSVQPISWMMQRPLPLRPTRLVPHYLFFSQLIIYSHYSHTVCLHYFVPSSEPFIEVIHIRSTILSDGVRTSNSASCKQSLHIHQSHRFLHNVLQAQYIHLTPPCISSTL